MSLPIDIDDLAPVQPNQLVGYKSITGPLSDKLIDALHPETSGDDCEVVDGHGTRIAICPSGEIALLVVTAINERYTAWLATKQMKEKSLDEFIAAKGWSAKKFADEAAKLAKFLQSKGVQVKIGRTVIHIGEGSSKVRCYVHYQGRSAAYASIVDDASRAVLITAHYQEFSKISDFLTARFLSTGSSVSRAAG